jgi:8-hydroxy-5-deazaflavin:NADPH oxidoreductase
MNIGILGSGEVGQKLGSGFIELGHRVKIGTRDPNQEKIKEWIKKSGDSASAGTFSQAAAYGQLIVVATSWNGTLEAIRMCDPKDLVDKTVIDVTNPLDFSAEGLPKLAVGYTDSAGEIIQRLLPEANVVKAFNTVGNPHMVHPEFPNGPPTMFICGNNDNAKKTVINEFLTKFGWESIDIGGIEGSRLLEPMAMLWITHYFQTNNGNHAFKLLHK